MECVICLCVWLGAAWEGRAEWLGVGLHQSCGNTTGMLDVCLCLGCGSVDGE